jgi:carbonic anhydrase/SulP family sulfate permease
MSFIQPDFETTISELLSMFGDFALGASIIGVISIALLVLWNTWKPLKESLIPAPLAVVLFGIACSVWFEQLGDPWLIKPNHLVQVSGYKRHSRVVWTASTAGFFTNG